jgi:hypothetical protein
MDELEPFSIFFCQACSAGARCRVAVERSKEASLEKACQERGNDRLR